MLMVRNFSKLECHCVLCCRGLGIRVMWGVISSQLVAYVSVVYHYRLRNSTPLELQFLQYFKWSNIGWGVLQSGCHHRQGRNCCWCILEYHFVIHLILIVQQLVHRHHAGTLTDTCWHLARAVSFGHPETSHGSNFQAFFHYSYGQPWELEHFCVICTKDVQ